METKTAEKVRKIIRSLMKRRVESEPDEILAVYLFGSTVSGKNTLSSDIDIAFLVAPDAYKADPVSAIRQPYLVAAEIGMRMKTQTDVTILNSASLEMAFEIITTGDCLYEKDTDRRLEYEIALKGMFFDFKPFLDELRAGCIAAL